MSTSTDHEKKNLMLKKIKKGSIVILNALGKMNLYKDAQFISIRD